MIQTPTPAVPKIIWKNLIFFVVTTFCGVFVAPFYIYYHGFSWAQIALFIFYVVATGMSITVGYHRLFAHRTFKASKLVDFLILFFGAAAFEQSALDWSSQHRDHHRYVDTESDPYSIKKGFFYAHIGWLIFWKHKINYENARDLESNRLLMHQHNHYHLWAIGSGILLPTLIGALMGQMWGAFLLAVCLRLAFVHQSTFCINSVCHMFGKPTYDIYSTAKDHWFVAFLTNGEGYHNFHHRFPGDYRNAVRWYQWDPSKWTIALLAKLGLAYDLKRTSRFSILQAKLAAEKQRASDTLLESRISHEFERLEEKLKAQYERLCQNLSHWEGLSKKYQPMLAQKAPRFSRLKATAKIRQARERFDQVRAEWNLFLKNAVAVSSSPSSLNYQ